MSMKFEKLIVIIIFVAFSTIIFAKPVSIDTATKVAAANIVRAGKGTDFFIKSISSVSHLNKNCFYAFELSPVGYLIIAADDALPPVLAYSFQNNLDTEGKLFEILKADITKRLEAAEKIPAAYIIKRKQQWIALTGEIDKLGIVSQQWPPAGTTSTGGWLETNWTQNAPYNQMCPIDPVTHGRSYVGCPATAMAQILNYHKNINNTFFDDGDDYFHNYAGRTFSIDNDFAQHGFPSFSQLNVFLDTLNSHFQNNISLTNQDKAALSFACGVAATQVFTSAGSGTFAVGQALNAYQRFNCISSNLLLNTDTSLFAQLIQNMKDSLPAHLAIVDAAWSTGHNIVVDGYNTDNYFHCNFGWGGPSNGWYLLPDEMPYSMTVIEGVIVDIMKLQNVSIAEAKNAVSFQVYPNPAHLILTINTGKSHTKMGYHIEILNSLGQVVFQTLSYQQLNQIDIKNFAGNGVYFVRITDNDCDEIKVKKFIINKF